MSRSYLRWIYAPRRYMIDGALVRPYFAVLVVMPSVREVSTPEGFYYNEQGVGRRPPLTLRGK